MALLKALPDGLLKVRAYSPELGETGVEDQTAGSAEEPAKITLTFKK